ncbi:MAG: hypothetical protein ABI165_20915 [Bryobacteraceae bacterium]
MFQQYLMALGETQVFITSLDKIIARIYPISKWTENEILFEQGGENTEALANIQFRANQFGADSDIDSSGRVLMPQKLRQALKLENQPVYLDCQKGRINVYSEAVYAELCERVEKTLAEDLRTAEKMGLK